MATYLIWYNPWEVIRISHARTTECLFSSVVKLKATFLPEMISLFPCYMADRILPGWPLPDSPALSCNPSAPPPTPIAQAWESFCTKITLTHSSCLKISIFYSGKLSLILGLGRVTLLYIPL